jgi:multiple sugar transport system substrate-binding protein
LEPLDAYWAKYKDEFNLGDYPDSVLDSYRYNGKLYGVPAMVNGMFMFYRQDLLEAEGFKPPTTYEEWLAIAKALNSPRVSGVVINLKRVDAGLNEAHYYVNAYGDGWFDTNWKPIFNSPKGVEAIERLKQMAAYAQRGLMSSANDEAMITFQQGLGATGIQWFTRATTMDDATKSKVIGKIAWAPAPKGHARIVVDGYAISRFSSHDKDEAFRVLAAATGEKNQRAAAADAVPSRASVLNDKALQSRYRYYPAALAALQVGQAYPALPEFLEAGDFITLRLQQAIAGEMPVKTALDTAAKQVEAMLAGRGYYK